MLKYQECYDEFCDEKNDSILIEIKIKNLQINL
jgi:hypothetical protein